MTFYISSALIFRKKILDDLSDFDYCLSKIPVFHLTLLNIPAFILVRLLKCFKIWSDFGKIFFLFSLKGRVDGVNSAGQTQRNQLRFGASFELTNQNHKTLTSTNILSYYFTNTWCAEKNTYQKIHRWKILWYLVFVL